MESPARNLASTQVRLALLDSSRTTEVTSILASLAIGLGMRAYQRRGNSWNGALRIPAREYFFASLDATLAAPLVLRQLDPTWIGYFPTADVKDLTRPSKYRLPDFRRNGKMTGRTNEPMLRLLLPPKKSRLQPYPPYVFGGRRRRRGGAKGQLEAVALPVDGCFDLLRGHHGGSISVLAAGAPGWLKPAPGLLGDHGIAPEVALDDLPQEMQIPRYFVLVTRREKPIDALRSDWPANGPRGLAAARPLAAIPALKAFFDQIGQARSGTALRPSIVTVSPFAKSGYQELLAQKVPCREFHGSPVAAALTVASEKFALELFCGIVRQTQAYLIAAAAAAMGAQMLAVRVRPNRNEELPVARRGKRRGATAAELPDAGGTAKPHFEPEHTHFVVDPDALLLERDDFVGQQKDFFLVATGVTDQMLLRGATVDVERKWASTHTLAINAKSQTRRYITHERKLDNDYFFDLHGQETDALKVMRDFIDLFHAENDDHDDHNERGDDDHPHDHPDAGTDRDVGNGDTDAMS